MLVYNMKQDKRFLNALDDWGSILTDTYERNIVRCIEVTGRDINVNIGYKSKEGFLLNTVTKGVHSLVINKIYDDPKNGKEGKFIIVKPVVTQYINFYVHYEDLIINGIPADEYILNMFANNPNKYEGAELHPDRYIIMTLFKDEHNLPGEPFNYYESRFSRAHKNIKTKINPQLKEEMLKKWNRTL